MFKAIPGDHVAAKAAMREPAEVMAVVDAGIAAFDELRFVVSCAGIPSAAKTVTRGAAHDLDPFDRVLAISLTGSFKVLCMTAER